MAGRPKGIPKTGGRKKGTPNRATAAQAAAIAATGLTPVEFLLSVMRDPKEGMNARLSAATSVAPYVHPKLAQIDMKAKVDSSVKVEIVRYSPPESVGPEEVSAAAVDSAGEGL